MLLASFSKGPAACLRKFLATLYCTGTGLCDFGTSNITKRLSRCYLRGPLQGGKSVPFSQGGTWQAALLRAELKRPHPQPHVTAGIRTKPHLHCFAVCENKSLEAGVLAWWLGTLSALMENQNAVPSPHIGPLPTVSSSSSKGTRYHLLPFIGHVLCCTLIPTHTHDTHSRTHAHTHTQRNTHSLSHTRTNTLTKINILRSKPQQPELLHSTIWGARLTFTVPKRVKVT